MVRPLFVFFTLGIAAANAADLSPLELRFQEGKAPEQVRVGDVLNLVVLGLTLTSETEKLSFEVVQEQGSEKKPSLLTLGWFIGLAREGDSLVLQAAPLKGGTLVLPSLEISGKEALALTSPFTVVVEPIDAPPGERPDILPPVSLQFPWWFALVIGVLVFLLALLIIAMVARWHGRNKPSQPLPLAPSVPLKPEDSEALEALDALERRALWESGEFKAHYFGASDILKAYLSRRYSFDARESTFFEIDQELEAFAVGESVRTELRNLTEVLDRVKFTDFSPGTAEARGVLAAARAFVTHTRRLRQEEVPLAPR